MRIVFLLLATLSFLPACQQKTDDTLEEILQNKELIVVTRNAPTTYYHWHDELAGPEYDMTQSFARALGVKVKYVLKNTTSEILDAIDNGEAHIAAAGLTRTDAREDSFLFGPVYQHVEQQIVCRKGGKRPKSLDQMDGIQLVVSESTSYVERLNELKQEQPQLTWRVDEKSDTELLLEQVWLKKIDCTVADSNITDINRRYYPELVVQFKISKPEPLSWVFPPGVPGLVYETEHWFEEYKDSGKLTKVMERYYGFIEDFDYVDNRRFTRRISTVLPRYKSLFKKAAQKYEFNWTLLAAQAYQESHWRPRAKSPTGVRGIMMLTLTTAKELGVKSRLDPEQSIMGGGLYLKRLYKRLPEEVEEPDRTWFALAAYNVGMGHLYDAMELAKRLNVDHTTWDSLSEVLPLLSQKRYYKTLKYGYARGNEPVSYVRHIRDYQNILVKKLNNE